MPTSVTVRILPMTPWSSMGRYANFSSSEYVAPTSRERSSGARLRPSEPTSPAGQDKRDGKGCQSRIWFGP